MAKLIFEGALGPATVKVYWNRDDEEYSARLWCGKTERKGAAYHTSDADDALGTAQAMLTRNNCGKSVLSGCGCSRRSVAS